MRSVLQFIRHFPAILGELLHHLFVQPYVHLDAELFVSPE